MEALSLFQAGKLEKERYHINFIHLLKSHIFFRSQRVRLRIEEYSTEICSGCGCDSIKVYDGGEARGSPLASLCGYEVGREFISTGNSLFISFTSDDTVTDYGFRASFIGELIAPGDDI